MEVVSRPNKLLNKTYKLLKKGDEIICFFLLENATFELFIVIKLYRI